MTAVEDKKYAYFLGCLTPNRYPGIEHATIEAFKILGVELVELKGASCCPAPGVFGSFDLFTWATVAARNLLIAEQQGNNISMTCNGCYGSLQETNHLLHENPDLKERVNKILKEATGHEYQGTVKVKHTIEVLRDEIGFDTVRDAVVKPLTGLRVGIHYGCHFLKPSKVRGQGSSERPRVLDDFINILGAESVMYKDRNMCCGAGGGVRAYIKDVALDFTSEKVQNMQEAGVDIITTPCAFCHFQFDVGQQELNKAHGTNFNIPVVFYTQLLAIALGISPLEMGLETQSTSVQPFLDKL
ncbi:MAG: CoB--CoM heterodisulfide reductase subunit B [Candidatus Helarchaeota archaeon]|nr:CoB--CoM heterodisulfide reductase subunit B [Candidatus Helarchaeota archaeon]